MALDDRGEAPDVFRRRLQLAFIDELRYTTILQWHKFLHTCVLTK